MNIIKYKNTSFLNGGARRDRTADPLLAKQVLSQLSYGPVVFTKNAVGHGAQDFAGRSIADWPRTSFRFSRILAALS